MRLLSKYNQANVLATIVVLILSAVIYYFFIDAALIHQLDKSLKVEEKEINDFIKENNQLPEPTVNKDEQELYFLTEIPVKRSFRSVELPNKKLGDYKLYRQLEFPVTINGKWYKADVRKSQEETEDLVQLILLITLVVVLILLIVLFIINRYVLNNLWKPFQTTLEQIKQFNLSGKEEVHLENTRINEFAELNEAVSIMTKRVSKDYNEIKSFTENASHEIQTPLAIIISRLELLSQSENLKEEQMNIIQSISATTNRLSKLNQSLILLSKIENQQFRENEKINFTSIIHQHLSNYEELLQAKNIALVIQLEENVSIMMNETLAEILIINLLTNAIKHNLDNGSIIIELTHTFLKVANTGKPPATDPSVYFERFKKDSVSNDSLGLGLSIVKKICDAYSFDITYHFVNNQHQLTIHF